MIPRYSGSEAHAWLQKRNEELNVSSSSKSHKIADVVQGIISDVRDSGDEALQNIARRLGDATPVKFAATDRRIVEVANKLPGETQSVIKFAAERIRRFAEAIMASVKPVQVQFDEYRAGIDFRPVARAACYVPAGRYPLPSTALMTAITAKVAGVKEVCLFSPLLNDEIIFAGLVAGVTEFHQLGGAQAIAAAALGTESIKRVDIIVGPGNAYVTEAKRQLQGRVAIDMLAGPSEIAIIADNNSDPHRLCLDLISQAEHDSDARAYLLTNDASTAETVIQQLPAAVESLNLPDYIFESLSNSAICILGSLEECVEFANQIAPEHLLLQVAKPESIKPLLQNYGALFMGYDATVPHGDYVAGPNHTLPTAGSARFASGLTPLTFLRTQSWLNVPSPALQLSAWTAKFAAIEGLHGHQAAANARLNKTAAARS